MFSRIGAILMLMPALGESMIPMHMRLSFALAFTLVLYPLLSPRLPSMIDVIMSILGPIFRNNAIGIMLRYITRITFMTTQVAGALIAFQTGLSSAMAADPTQ